MSQLECRDVALGYEGTVVCEHVSFSVEQGDCLCVIGDNGSGKSTLMKALLRLKAPKEGEILLGDGLAQRDIGYLPQQNEAQKDFPASVWEVVLSGCVTRGDFGILPGRGSKRRTLENMERLGVLSLKKKPFRSLSGGQQQRVLLARALCAAERLLLLDEPTAGLDPLATEEMYETVRHLNQTMGITVIMITHDLASVLRLGTKVLVMGKTPAFYPSVEAYRQSVDFLGGREDGREN